MINLGLLIAFIGCDSDKGITRFNSTPEATIVSHFDGDSVLEGFVTTVRGAVSDPNHDNDTLNVRWYVQEREVCSGLGTEDGLVTCDIVFENDDTELSIEVSDPEGAAAAESIQIQVTPTDPPTALIFSPVLDENYYSDTYVTFSGKVEDTEDQEETLTAIWNSSIDGELEVDTVPDSEGDILGAAYLSEGEHFITLTVTDSSGKQGVESVIVQVGPPNNSPECAITSPENAFEMREDDSFTLLGTALDLDIESPLLFVEWSSDIDGILGTSIPDSSGDIQLALNGLSAGVHLITLTVKDERNLSCTDNISIDVEVGNYPPVLEEVIIEPLADIYVNDTLTCSYIFSDTDGDSVTATYEWNNDTTGTWMGSAQELAIDHTTVDPNDVISCMVTITDPSGESANGSQTKIVRNSSPEVTTVTISPSVSIKSDSTLTCSATSSDADIDISSFSYQWSVGSNTLAFGDTITLSASQVQPLDSLTCTVTATDSLGATASDSTSVTVENTPPVIASVSISPDPAFEGDILTCTPNGTSDIDGSTNISYAYSWSVNGVDMGVSSNTLGSTYFNRDDQVQCNIIPDDGMEAGATESSTLLTVTNTPPEILSIAISPDPAASADALLCTYSGFSDADGDLDASTIAWRINGVSVGTGDTLSSGFIGGDVVECAVTPHDDTDAGSILTTSLNITQSAPTLLVAIDSPGCVSPYSTLTCTPTATDADGNSMTLNYEWSDGNTILGTTNTLDINNITAQPGDDIICTVTAIDSTGLSTTVSETITVESAQTLSGDISFDTQGDVEDFCMCNDSVTGNVTIDNSTLIDLDGLFCLRSVGGNMRILSNTALLDASIPNLTDTGDITITGNTSLENITFDSLLSISALSLTNNSDLISVSAPILDSATSYITVENNTVLETVSFPLLEQITNNLRIEQNPRLSNILLDSLNYVSGFLKIMNNDLLTELSLISLTGVGNDVNLSDNDRLEMISMNATDTINGQFLILNNELLEVLDTPVLSLLNGNAQILNSGADLAVNMSSLQNVSGNVHLRDNDLSSVLLSNLRTVEFSLTVYNNSSLDDLSLSSLETVGSDFLIHSNSALESLNTDVFEQLDGSFNIYNNAQLEDISVPALSLVDGAFNVYNNPSLESVQGMLLNSIQGNLDIHNNAVLHTSIFPLLTHINGGLYMYNHNLLDTLSLPSLQQALLLQVYANPIITELDLPSLHTLSSLCFIYNNADLTQIDLGDLTTTGGELNIRTNYQLNQLKLDSLTEIGGNVSIQHVHSSIQLPLLTQVGGNISLSDSTVTQLDTPLLSSMNGNLTLRNNAGPSTLSMPNLSATVSYVTIENNTEITRIQLPQLAEATNINIHHNDDVISISLEALTHVQNLSIYEQELLNEIEAPVLESVDSTIAIYSNEALTAIAFPNLNQFGDGGISTQLNIHSNTLLTSISLNALTVSDGAWEIRNNPALTSFAAPMSTEIKKSLRVWSNASLSTIELPNITHVGSDLYVYDNASLTSFSLPVLETIDGTLTVQDNSSLQQYNVSNLQSIGGNTTITGGNGLDIPMPLLTSIDGFLKIHSNTFGSLNFNLLNSMSGDLLFYSNAGLNSLSFPALQGSVTSLKVYKNDDLETLSLPQITTLTSLDVYQNDDLTSISLHALDHLETLSIQNNNSLNNISVPVLSSITKSMSINGNPMLTSLNLNSVSQLGQATGAWECRVENNGSLQSLSLDGISYLNGDLHVVGHNALETISLAQLERIEQNLKIEQNSSLLQVNMPVLEDVYGFVGFRFNDALETVEMPLLKDIGEFLLITENPSLSVLDLSSVESIGGYFSLSGGNTLAAHFDALDTVLGTFTITDSDFSSLSIPNVQTIDGTFTFSDNSGLTSLDVSNLDTGVANVQISNNTQLNSIDFHSLDETLLLDFSDNLSLSQIDLSNLSSVGGALKFNHNAIMDISLPMLTSISSSLSIQNNGTLYSVSIPNLVVSAAISESILVRNNGSLFTISFDALTTSNGNFRVQLNPALDELYLPLLNEITGNLMLTDNGLVSLDVSNVSTIQGELSIQRNTFLQSLDLPSLSSLNELITIKENNMLSSIYIPQLETVYRYVDISNNSSLLNIDLSALTSITNSCTMSNNTLLTDINLSILNSIGQDLILTTNGSLDSLDDLYAISSIGRNLNISYNMMLTDATVQSFVSNVGTSNVGGAIVTVGNAP